MHTRELLHNLHAELQAIITKGTVLLGGSYVYGESTPGSDVDFFVLVPLWKIFSYRDAVRAWKKNYPEVQINITIVPGPAFKHGWFYVYGRTLAGELVAGPFNQQVKLTMTLKLAYYNYIKYRLATPPGQVDALQKVAQKIGILETVRQHQNKLAPPLATSYIKRRLKGIQAHDWAIQVLEAKTNHQAPPKPKNEQIEASLEREYQLCFSKGGFSWGNYFIYNLKFLPRGRGLFLWHNPDKIILDKIRQTLTQNGDLQALYLELVPIIFPVIML